MEKARVHIFIEGEVQGVFYRAFTREIATKLGLTGWVKNLFDGRVEAIFEGKKSDIEKAIEKCYQGPPAAEIKNIAVEWELYTAKFSGFEIRYY